MRTFSRFVLISVLAVGLPIRFAQADYKQAVIYYNQGHYDKAIQELKPDLDRNSEWEFGHRLLGLCYLNLRNNALAVSSLSRAVQLKSTAFSTYYGLAQAYFNMQKFDDCIAALNQGEAFVSKEKDPEKERASLYRLRGTAYYRMERFSEALNDLTNAIRINQSNWADFSMLGIAYFKLNRTDEAIQSLEKALSMKPGENTTTDVLAKAYLKKGASALAGKQYSAAVQALLKAESYDPKNGYIYFNLAESYLFEGNYSDAEKALNQAVALIPENRDIYERMGLVYEKQKKWDLALSAYKKAESIKSFKKTRESIERVLENKKK
jgi:protein O-GlcNAc transferase